jgi:DNA-binding transcriptional regulator GbsR (MarR family)
MPATKDTTSVRITRTAHEKLQRLAEARGQSLTEALDRIIEAQRRQHLFDQADQRYADLHEDEEAWDEVKRERDELDGALADGLEEQDV